MNAQFMYDLREKYEFCSGQDLSDWFFETTGDPAPGGKSKISSYHAERFVMACAETEKHNSGDTKEARQRFLSTMEWFYNNRPEKYDSKYF